MTHSRTNKPPTVGVCATCPWRIANHGKPHPAGWYRIANLRRIWNGIRTGKAPGFVCHATDPKSKEYGAVKEVPLTAKTQECGGVLLIIFRHMKAVSETTSYKDYVDAYPLPFKKPAIAHWLQRHLFSAIGNPIPAVTCDDPNLIGLPWENTNGR